MKTTALYCPLEYHHSQADDKTLILALVCYDTMTGNITWEIDKKQANELLLSYFPNVQFRILDPYFTLIQQKLSKHPAQKNWVAENLKNYLDTNILTPDDGALRWGKITQSGAKEWEKYRKTYLLTEHDTNAMKNKFEVLVMQPFIQNGNEHLLSTNEPLAGTTLIADRAIGEANTKNVIWFINLDTANGLKKVQKIAEEQTLLAQATHKLTIDLWLTSASPQKAVAQLKQELSSLQFATYFPEQWIEYAKKMQKKYMSKKAKIYYFRFPTMPSKAEKLQLIKDTKFEDIPFERITPDEKGNWINQTDNDFQTLIPLCSKDVKFGRSKEAIFELYTGGYKTNRDEWVFDFDKENLAKKVQHLIEKYNAQVDSGKIANEELDYSIKWSSTLKEYLYKRRKINFDKTKIIEVPLRPFVNCFYHTEKMLSDRLTDNHYKISGKDLDQDNLIITINEGGRLKLAALVTRQIPSYSFYVLDASQSIPFYRYENGERVENITDWGLAVFQQTYSPLTPEGGTDVSSSKIGVPNHPPSGAGGLCKLDIFHYIYAVLHSPDYRKTYELDLKREFPRIPLYADFWKYAVAGKRLMELHLNYELEITNYDLSGGSKPPDKYSPLLERKDIELAEFLEKVQGKKKSPNVSPPAPEGGVFDELTSVPPSGGRGLISPILRIKDDIIFIDELTTLSGVPAQALAYKLGNRSAIEWILDQYKPYKSDDKTIQEHFNNYDFADYKEEVIELLQKVCWVSVETMKIVEKL